MASFGQIPVDPGAHELVGHREHDAGPIAGVGLGSHGSSVVQVNQDADALLDDQSFVPSVEGGNHAETAGIVFRIRVIEPLGAVDMQIERGRE